MISELLNQGIRLKHQRPGPQKILCPRCSASRKPANQKDPCLSVIINDKADFAGWNCHNCHWTGGAGNVSKGPSHNPDSARTKVYKKPENAGKYTSVIPTEVMNYLTNTRKISKEVIERNGLLYEPHNNALCFPFRETLSDRIEVVNIKHRAMADKKFWLEAEAKIIFYGLEDIGPNEKELIIVEGEFDKLALNTCGFWNVVSVPHGAPATEVDPERTGTKWDFVVHAEEMLKRMTKVVMAVDNDEKGKFLEKELIRRIGADKCWIVEFPQKDANDTLIELGPDVVCECINEAKPMPVRGLFSVQDFEGSALDLFENGMRRGVGTGWPNADNFYTVMTGQVSVVTGVPNSGKSELLDAMTLNLSKYHDWKFAVFSPENGKEQHLIKLVEKITEKPTDPKHPDRISKADFIDGMRWVSSRYFFIVADDQNDSPTIDWILAKAKAAVLRYGIKGLVIDPYNEIEHTMPKGMQETTYVSQMLSKLKKFAKANDVHVWIIAHPAKMQKDKDGNVMVPGLYDISGSANWVNKADAGIVVHRNATPNVTEVHFKKIRFKHVGRQGVCYLLYDRDTGTYSVPESEAQYTAVTKQPKQKKETQQEEEFFDSELVQF